MAMNIGSIRTRLRFVAASTVRRYERGESFFASRWGRPIARLLIRIPWVEDFVLAESQRFIDSRERALKEYANSETTPWPEQAGEPISASVSPHPGGSSESVESRTPGKSKV